MSSEKKVWFITGVGRGFGKELAQAVLARGDVVIGTSRDGRAELDSGPGILHVLPLDLRIPADIRDVVDRAYGLYVRIDVLVNNAGFGLMGSVEECGDAEVANVFEVNFFGPLRLIQSILPLMRARRAGHIVNISSIAGLAPMAGSGLYAATKFALEGMSESLAQEVAPLGIHVTLVEPGAFRTEFLSPHSMRRAARRIDDYTVSSGRIIAHLEQAGGRQLGNPARGAEAIVEAVESPHPPLHLILGSDAVGRARAKVRQLEDDIDHWESVSIGTDFADAKR